MNSKTRLQLSVSLSVVAVALGMMVSIQYKQASTQRDLSSLTNATGAQTTKLTNQLTALQKESQSEQQQLQNITGQITTYENKASANDSKLQALQSQLSSARILAGTTAVEGQGIEFTVTDGTPPSEADAQSYLTHDWDVRSLVNEMFLSGAEAVSVNGYRIVATSGIFCRGPVITVNGHRMTAPFDFKAIGDAHNMSYGLQMSGGVFSLLEDPQNNLQISPVKTKAKLIIPAYTGTVAAPPTTTGN